MNKKSSFGMLLLKLRTFIMLILLIIVFGLTTKSFLSPTSIILMVKHSAIYGIIAIGMTFVIISNGIDLSVGSVVGLSGMIAGGLIYEGLRLPMFNVSIYFNVLLVIIITLGIGILVGAINGYVVSRLKVPAFIATLGMFYVARGFALIRSNGETFPNLAGKAELGNTGFPILGLGTLLGIPYSIYITAIIAIIAIYISKKTPLGWHIYAVGGNERAAQLSGVKVHNTMMFVYMFSGFCAALVGLIQSSQISASHPMTGETYEMNAIAAAVLGGTSMNGGIGTIGGTLIGALIIAVLGDGMVMLGIPSFWQMVIKGAVIVFAVIIDMVQRKIQKKAALQSQAMEQNASEFRK